MENVKVAKPYGERFEQSNEQKGEFVVRNGLLLSPVAPLACDDSLTCLNWLQNVRLVNYKAVPVIQEQQESFSTSCSDSDESSCSDGDLYQEITSNVSFRKCLDELAHFKKSKKDHLLELSKPGYSYVTLIFLAITSSSTDMTLHDICKWIKDNFCYYRVTAFGWQNSVRHNLSTNNLFVKISRVTGKGNYWRINPRYIEFINGGHSKRRNSHCTKSRKKRCCDHCQSQSVPDPCKVPGDLDWISLLGSQKVNCSKCGRLPSHSIGFSPFVSPDLTSYVTDTTTPSTTCGLKMLKSTQPDAVFNADEQSELPYLVQDSPFVLPGADSRPHSPISLDTKFHPWAESTPEKTRHLGLNWTNYSPYPLTTANAAMAQ